MNSDAAPPTANATAPRTAMPGGGTTVEEMSDSSFPASDPPAVWTWDVELVGGRDAEGHDHERSHEHRGVESA